MMVKAAELKKGSKIIFEGQGFTIENIEFSKIGKMGKAKCRIEAISEKKEKKVFILQTDEEIQLQ